MKSAAIQCFTTQATQFQVQNESFFINLLRRCLKIPLLDQVFKNVDFCFPIFDSKRRRKDRFWTFKFEQTKQKKRKNKKPKKEEESSSEEEIVWEWKNILRTKMNHNHQPKLCFHFNHIQISDAWKGKGQEAKEDGRERKKRVKYRELRKLMCDWNWSLRLRFYFNQMSIGDVWKGNGQQAKEDRRERKKKSKST